MSDGMGREFTYLSSHATNRYFIPNWGNLYKKKYHIFQQACNALLVNMLKAGRWLFYLPVIYQPSTSMAQPALIGL